MTSGPELHELIPLVAIAGGILIAIVSIICNTMRSASKRRQMEESRREIAAYVAEGTMTPDDAKKLLDAGPKDRKCCGL